MLDVVEMKSKVESANAEFGPFATKMVNEGLPKLAIDSFGYYYQQLHSGATGYIPGGTAQPVLDLPDADDLAIYAEEGEEALSRTIVLRLNGGLGTSMGMNGPKSLVPVKDGLSFLDISVRQILHLRKRYDVRLPLVLMNSFTTEEETEAALQKYPALKQAMPFGFLQHKVPKIDKATLQPAKWAEQPEKEWCPPGHGDLYPALVTSGMLDQMLDAGYEYLFVSNSDNLGATLDLDILGYFASEEIPFMMEVAYRTAADRKGGHLAQMPEDHDQAGQLILREVAQCPPEEIDDFQDISRYRYFNTNNLWIHLPSLQHTLEENNGVLPLPLIRNEKAVDPTQSDSPRVFQLETAMGSAIGVFSGAHAISVHRSRFAPVKKNSDLLGLLSDAYQLTDEYHLELTSRKAPIIKLDERYYQLISDLKKRFPHGAPSLVECESFEVIGDVYFGKGIKVKGNVVIEHQGEEPLFIADGAELTN
ncbi:MAG: UTP--glucose-1-phosphate uridylyltransferase [Chloroflexota bacterium]